MIYYIVYFFIASLSILCLRVKERQKKWLWILGAGIILLFQSLRWRTGTDWTPYYLEFESSLSMFHDSKFELGYVLLNQFIRLFTGNYTSFLFLECFLNILFIGLFIKKMPINNPLLGLLYFFAIAIFPIRYTLASSIVIYSYTYIIKNKFIPFLCLIILSFTIHRTTIIFLPLFFLCKKHYSFSFLLLIYSTCILLGILSDYTLGSVFKAASMIFGNMDGVVQEKMLTYLNGEIPEYGKMSFLRYCMSIFNSTIFILFFFYFKRKFFCNDQIYNVLFNLYVFGLSFNRVFFQLIPDLARLTSLFTGGYIIMIIMILDKYKINRRILLTIGVIGYLFINYYGTIHGLYEDLYIPYYSVFSDQIRFYVY